MENVCNAMLNGLNEKLQLIEWNWIEYGLNSGAKQHYSARLNASRVLWSIEIRDQSELCLFNLQDYAWNMEQSTIEIENDFI